MGDIGPGGYRKLRAWQKSHLLATTTYKTTRALKREDYWVQQQICRAAFSVPSNIVEGYARRSRKAYLHALDIAMASLTEVEYQLLFMRDVELIDEPTYLRIERLRYETGALLYGLIRSLAGKARSSDQELREPTSEFVPNSNFDGAGAVSQEPSESFDHVNPDALHPPDPLAPFDPDYPDEPYVP